MIVRALPAAENAPKKTYVAKKWLTSFEAQLRTISDPIGRIDALIRNRVCTEIAADVAAVHLALDRLRRRLRGLDRDFQPPLKRKAAGETESTDDVAEDA